MSPGAEVMLRAALRGPSPPISYPHEPALIHNSVPVSKTQGSQTRKGGPDQGLFVRLVCFHG
ncbi:hypothetical protein LUU34_00273700 [Aix galericulata]|nr:hypothetical protein LUU34_00273700 [Aix galericulata]